jgi:two-component system cell cycle sensor histidine kinase/response regulator CckA
MADDKISSGGKAQLFRSIFEQNVIGIVLCDLDGTILEGNAAFREMVGYTEKELRARTIVHLTHPADRPDTDRFLSKASEAGSGPTDYVSEKRYLRKDGRTVWGRVNATAIRDGAGAAIFNFAVVEDITQRKAAEEELQAEQERLAVTLHCIGDAVVSTDADGRIALFNEVAVTFTGWSQDEARGRLLSDVLHLADSKDRHSCQHLLNDAIQHKIRFSSSTPFVLVSRDGTERYVSGTGNPIAPSSRAPEGMVFAFHDVTDKARAEEEHARTEKLESLGYLAGGIAHDFNNLLTTILGNISLARMDTPGGNETGELLRQAEQASLEARHLTQQLLTFAKGGVPIKQVVQPGLLIRESVELALHGSSCRPELHLPEHLWPIEVDPNLIGQVIRHLVINADQAMPGGGLSRHLGGECPDRSQRGGRSAAGSVCPYPDPRCGRRHSRTLP